MSEQYLWYIIICLVGIILGGSRVASAGRKLLKIPETADQPTDSQTDSSALSTAASAAASAAATAATVAASAAFRLQLVDHLRPLEEQALALNERVAKLDGTVHEFLGSCPEKHKAIDQRQDSFEKQLQNCRTNCSK